ncbi:hypothetical protein HX882_26985 [Pseudomonas gingeri]|uniref:Uncharacterized protein n=1 Tax=Pseudomonas gingeri TaxID=117681 RepID=A0A7Y7XIL6_9PSED|nr:hypothetical protein [Pseudomonas gingeri]NWB99538.1 hypothetical protein [Pseudomonas gingeri]
MFDITPDDINQLNDIDLRELVGRLCEAELQRLGLSPSAVTWGGNQTAADGGLDVRVSLPSGADIEGFVPRFSTGFQVKKPDMPRADIITEMRPAGVIRPVIQALADEAGAYIIVSSAGSTADSALRNRQGALREALGDVSNAIKLHTDFYDRTRLATWVRCHPGLIAWVKGRVGRTLVGWQPYGPWSGKVEGIEAEYLLDDKLRLCFGRQNDLSEQSMEHAIDQLRDELALPGKVVRLVGLSGVGKTRLVQALFDERVGRRPLPKSLAVYTNLSDDPDPQPTGMASNLIANRMRAILIVDNCPQELHRRLSELCIGQDSTVSVLTVEYDVRDDEPEGTQVVTLDTSSLELIEVLVQRRYPYLSQVNARTVAESSGGNARIAIALAETVKRSDSIAGLSSEELFERLFQQRHAPDNTLLRAAQAFSLVYSFQGEALVGEAAELPALAALAGQAVADTYRHVGELLRRDLVQQRGHWRALLPHAIANRLAARGLEDTPYDLINQFLVGDGTGRLARSLSRRLSFLHDHPKAVAIVESWLAPDGFLGDVTVFTDHSQAMFENIAPVSPKATLAALERAGNGAAMWYRHGSLMRSLAYEPTLFERSTRLLVLAATQSTDERKAKEISETFESLFLINFSGTHASIGQRLAVIEGLLNSGETKFKALGLAALEKVLETTFFGSIRRFDFGARSRDYGYEPECDAEVTQWYSCALNFIARLASTDEGLNTDLRGLLARSFSGLWSSAGIQDELVTLFHQFAAGGFWREGWLACRQLIHFDKQHLPSEDLTRLSELVNDLKPSNTLEQVRAVVLGDRASRFDLSDLDDDDHPLSVEERLEATIYELAATIIVDDTALAEILPELLQGGMRVWSFGRGLARASSDIRETWMKLVEVFEQVAQEHRNVGLFNGVLAELWGQNRSLAQELLDSVLDQPALVAFLPTLHSAVELDERGVDRLKHNLSTGGACISAYQSLAYGRTTEHLAGGLLGDLLVLLAKQPGGFDVALEILHMRFFSDHLAQRGYEPELLEAGRELMRCVVFLNESNESRDHHLADVVRACFATSEASSIVAEITARLKQAVATDETHVYCNDGLFKALYESQPLVVLDALFSDEGDERLGLSFFDRMHNNRGRQVDTFSSKKLIEWCDVDRERRYLLSASFVTFATRPDVNDPLIWSEHAKALLAHAPVPETVLAAFIKRFKPQSWTGSRAVLLEANAQLLDSLEWKTSPDLMSFVAEAKARLTEEILQEQQWETERDRTQDERFE